MYFFIKILFNTTFFSCESNVKRTICTLIKTKVCIMLINYNECNTKDKKSGHFHEISKL